MKPIIAALAVAMVVALSACTTKVVEIRQVVVTPTSDAAPTLTAQQFEYLEALATAQAVTPTVAAPPSPLPDRTTCEGIKGTDYRSAAEREWYLAHCAPTSAPAPPAPRYCPRDEVWAWIDQLSSLASEGNAILTDTTSGDAAKSERAANLYWRAAALQAPPCAIALQNRLVQSYYYQSASMDAAANGKYDEASYYLEKARTLLYDGTADAMMAQVQREMN